MSISTSHPQIAMILPPREGFSREHFGAISLCVRDFAEYSRFREQIQVIGGVERREEHGADFSTIPYHALTQSARWWESKTRSYSKQCLAWMRQENPTLVEVQNRPVIATFLAKKWQGKVALHLHNDPQEMAGAKTPRERKKLLTHCAAIYCVSDFIRQRFLEGLALNDSPNLHRVYNGLIIPSAEQVAQMTKKQYIIFVGRLQPEKGALELAQALAQLLPAHPDWRGIFIGASHHNPQASRNHYEQQVYSTVAPLIATGQVEMQGFCPHAETMAKMAESAIAVIPSRWNEPFGRTALEAMSVGCAVVSSVRGGLKEVVADAAVGIPTITAARLVQAIEPLLHDATQRQNWQEKALLQAQHFSIQHCTDRLDAIRGKLLF
jgi:glycosyltransferase involved in cell wall biosynthesis